MRYVCVMSTRPPDEAPAPPEQPPRRPEDFLGRRVRYGGEVGRVAEAHVLGGASVVILTRDGRLITVPADDWDALDIL